MASTFELARDNSSSIVGRKRPHSPVRGASSRPARVVNTQSSVGNIESRICAFCRRGHKEGLAFSRGFVDVVTNESIWASESPFVFSGKSFWAHTVCVDFSPQTSYDNNEGAWCNVNKEYSRSRSLTCTLCGMKGATIGCTWQKCNSSCHFPCVIEDGRRIWSPSKHLSESPFFCPNHQKERAEHERRNEMARLRDISQGRESVAIPLELPTVSVEAGADPTDPSSPEDRERLDRQLSTLPLPRGVLSGSRDHMDFKYVSSVVESKSARVCRGPEREKRCCRCTGSNACRDLSKCECLRDGRNYRLKGRRLDDCHPSRVYECNLNCRCHVDQCRNRLVQKGVTCSLVVSHVGRSGRVPSRCGEWGVKAAEDIPLGGFVCTVAGQLLPESDVVGVKDTLRLHRVRDWVRQPGQRRLPPLDAAKIKGGDAESAAMVIDQRHYANISRYIRRARFESDANLLRVAVYTENQDAKVPVLALFTDRHVGKGTELLLSLHAGSNRFMS